MLYLVTGHINEMSMISTSKYFDTKAEAVEYATRLEEMNKEIKAKYSVPPDMIFPSYTISEIEKGDIKQLKEQTE